MSNKQAKRRKTEAPSHDELLRFRAAQLMDESWDMHMADEYEALQMLGLIERAAREPHAFGLGQPARDEAERADAAQREEAEGALRREAVQKALEALRQQEGRHPEEHDGAPHG